MTWIIQEEVIGYPRIGVAYTPPGSGSVPNTLPQPGSQVHAQERAIPLGGGVFIWLPGAAGVVTGTLVTYDSLNNTVTVGGNPSSGAPVAFAVCNVPAGSFAWYQIAGAINNAVKDGTALVAGGTVGLGTVAGSVGAVVATRQLLGAKALNAAAAGATVCALDLNYPNIAQS